MLARPSPISREALKTIALVLHGAARGRTSLPQSRDIVVHALLLVRDSEGALDPDVARRWLEAAGGLPPWQAAAVRSLAARVAEGREIPGVGRSPLRPSTLQTWRDRAAGRAESPFERLDEAAARAP